MFRKDVVWLATFENCMKVKFKFTQGIPSFQFNITKSTANIFKKFKKYNTLMFLLLTCIKVNQSF